MNVPAHTNMNIRWGDRLARAALAVIAVVTTAAVASMTPREREEHVVAAAGAVRIYIIEGGSSAEAARAVRAVGGKVIHELAIIDAVSAELTRAQVDTLRVRLPDARITADGSVRTAGPVLETYYPTLYGDRKSVV